MNSHLLLKMMLESLILELNVFIIEIDKDICTTNRDIAIGLIYRMLDSFNEWISDMLNICMEHKIFKALVF